MKALYLILPVVLLALSVFLAIRMVKRGSAPRRALSFQLLSLLVIAVICLALPVVSASAADTAANATAAAADASDVATTATTTADSGMKYIGAALAVGLAGIGGGLAVAGGAPAAIGATAEDPKAFGKSIIFVALGEGFGLYGLLIAILCLVM